MPIICLPLLSTFLKNVVSASIVQSPVTRTTPFSFPSPSDAISHVTSHSMMFSLTSGFAFHFSTTTLLRAISQFLALWLEYICLVNQFLPLV